MSANTQWQQNSSLSLENQECFVCATFEQVKEAGPLSVVMDGQSEVLATDDVPSGAAIFSQFMSAKLSLNFGSYQFVKRMLLVGGLTHSDDCLANVEGHVSESNSVLGHGNNLMLPRMFSF